MNDIRISHEGQRGCGFRKQGGIYLFSEWNPAPCGRFPIPAETCPTCGEGIKPSRAWRWVDGDKIKEMAPECHEDDLCRICPMNPEIPMAKAGLIWIGSRHYRTPAEFLREAERMGVSRRLAAVPRGLMTHPDKANGPLLDPDVHVFLAHREAMSVYDAEEDELVPKPAIFAIWKPQRIEQVVSEDVTEEEVEKITKRGIEPVIVKPIQGEMFEDDPIEELRAILGQGQQSTGVDLGATE